MDKKSGAIVRISRNLQRCTKIHFTYVIPRHLMVVCHFLRSLLRVFVCGGGWGYVCVCVGGVCVFKKCTNNGLLLKTLFSS